jgi:hypothetical protein
LLGAVLPWCLRKALEQLVASTPEEVRSAEDPTLSDGVGAEHAAGDGCLEKLEDRLKLLTTLQQTFEKWVSLQELAPSEAHEQHCANQRALLESVQEARCALQLACKRLPAKRGHLTGRLRKNQMARSLARRHT